MEPTKYRQINWQDGMKLNKNHFILSDNFHISQQVFSRNLSLNENNFGILPSYDKSKFTYEIKLALDGDYILITKFKISAIMLNGMVLNADSDDIGSNNIDADSLKLKFRYSEYNEKNFVLILKTNSFKNIEYGKFESEDFQLKRAFLLPYFEFILVPFTKIKESFYSDDFFIILKFEVDGSQIRINDHYIPPVTSIISNKILTEFHNDLFNDLNSLEVFLLNLAKKHAKNKSDNYAETLVLISNNLINHISIIKYEVKHKLLFEPPIELVIRIKSLANIFSKTIEMRTSLGKDMFLNEVISIIGTSKHEFEELLKQVTNLDYRHFNIYDAVNTCANFIDTIMKIFRILSEGERKQTQGKQFDLKIKR